MNGLFGFCNFLGFGGGRKLDDVESLVLNSSDIEVKGLLRGYWRLGDLFSRRSLGYSKVWKIWI